MPAAILDPLFRRGAERRVAETLFIANDKMTDIEDAGEDALIAYHEKNADRFTAPEYRALSVLALLADDLAREIAVSDETLGRGLRGAPRRIRPARAATGATDRPAR